MACRLDGAKPLPEPMQEWCKLIGSELYVSDNYAINGSVSCFALVRRQAEVWTWSFWLMHIVTLLIYCCVENKVFLNPEYWVKSAGPNTQHSTTNREPWAYLYVIETCNKVSSAILPFRVDLPNVYSSRLMEWIIMCIDMETALIALLSHLASFQVPFHSPWSKQHWHLEHLVKTVTISP